MTTALLVALGAAVGAAGRHLTNHWLRERFGATPAGGTLAVNLLGSFVLGVLAGAAVDGGWLALLGIGFDTLTEVVQMHPVEFHHVPVTQNGAQVPDQLFARR